MPYSVHLIPAQQIRRVFGDPGGRVPGSLNVCRLQIGLFPYDPIHPAAFDKSFTLKYIEIKRKTS
jgi:hypothetical protein